MKLNNIVSFYDHLWAEAADECDVDNPINIHLDLTINSYEFISFKPLVSVKMLKKRIEESKTISLFLHETGSLLQITGTNDRKLNIYFQQSDYQSSEYAGDMLNLAGIVDDKPNMNKKEAMSFSIEKLDLRLFWEF